MGYLGFQYGGFCGICVFLVINVVMISGFNLIKTSGLKICNISIVWLLWKFGNGESSRLCLVAKKM